MFGVTRSRYQGRVEAGGSPQGARPVKADQKHGAPPAASTQPERAPGLDSPHQRSRVMDKAPTFVGIDVSKHRLDVHLRPSGESSAIHHDDEGVAGLVARLAALAPARWRAGRPPSRPPPGAPGPAGPAAPRRPRPAGPRASPRPPPPPPSAG